MTIKFSTDLRCITIVASKTIQYFDEQDLYVKGLPDFSPVKPYKRNSSVSKALMILQIPVTDTFGYAEYYVSGKTQICKFCGSVPGGSD